MTFYWWSHWFWITLLSNVLLSIVYVHSYPSHDIAPDYNSNNSDNKNTKTAVTKLYQTTTKFIWATATTTTTSTPPIPRVTEETVGQRKTRLQNIPRTVEAAAVDSIEEGEEADEEEAVEKTYKENVAVEEESNPADEYGDYEVKRSANENESNSNKIRAESDTVIGQEDQKAERQSDETAKQGAASSSLDRRSGDIKASEEKTSHLKRQEKQAKDFSEHPNLTNFSKTATKDDNNKTETQATAAASSWIPSQPQIENDSPATAECLDSREEQSTHNQQADGGDDNPSGARKVSFTLENVNKEEEILRAESEHRSRKSKELSAEYNHVSRFINFSTDSKNLLTRYASSTSNEYDSDEGNISSEALAIKRTAYFLDASAISAICFTAFGVCCTVGTLGVVLYRRRFLNKPQVLSEPDSSVYIDDSTIRDNSDEMYSLDNDSFLNSLEAMTIQNYWTDSVKHTKL